MRLWKWQKLVEEETIDVFFSFGNSISDQWS